jgi:hypothetical protein
MNFPIKWLLLLISTAILIITPDLAVWLVHALFELLHVLFELLEGMLDEVVEHVFHTDRHTTQIIVFYLILAMALYLAYRLYRYCKRRVIELKEAIPCWCKDKKEHIESNWQQQSIIKKCQFIISCFLGTVGISYLVF